jgi:hypothetical protein
VSRPARTLAVLAAALTLAAPAAALAKGAGDEQYADPFGQVHTKKKHSGSNQQSGPQAQAPSSQTTAPAQTQGIQTQTQPTQPAASSSSSSPELPRTGLSVALLAFAGIALLGAGRVLRRATSSG